MHLFLVMTAHAPLTINQWWSTSPSPTPIIHPSATQFAYCHRLPLRLARILIIIIFVILFIYLLLFISCVYGRASKHGLSHYNLSQFIRKMPRRRHDAFFSKGSRKSVQVLERIKCIDCCLDNFDFLNYPLG